MVFLELSFISRALKVGAHTLFESHISTKHLWRYCKLLAEQAVFFYQKV